jgi:uncharacterized protein YukE
MTARTQPEPPQPPPSPPLPSSAPTTAAQQPPDPVTAPTDFAVFDDQQLLAMLYAGTPEKVRALGDRWRVVATAMRDHGQDMESDFRAVRETWTGVAADAYEQEVRAIIDAAGKLADMADVLHDLIFSAADALRAAQDLLPPPEGWAGRDPSITGGPAAAS